MPKNVYITKDRIAEIESNLAIHVVPSYYSVDVESTEMFEKLNPVLSDGMRRNVISFLIDKNVPREIADMVSQMLVKIPTDSSVNNLTDEQILASIPSRDMQNEIELDIVRDALELVAHEFYPDSSVDVSVDVPVEPGSEPVSDSFSDT